MLSMIKSAIGILKTNLTDCGMISKI